jgi:hypothetical protein
MRSGKFRSGLEHRIAKDLKKRGVKFEYEERKIAYTKPVTNHTYLLDFELPGFIIEAKGFFTTADRKKHRLIKEQHPDLDIRFVFSDSRKKIYKGAKTSYGDWCDKYGFLYCDKEVPEEWLKD